MVIFDNAASSALDTPLSSLANQPFALVFAGQATPWRKTVNEFASGEILDALQQTLAEAERRTAPVAAELLTAAPTNVRLLGENPGSPHQDADAAVSVPGIFLAQYALLLALQAEGVYDLSARPVSPKRDGRNRKLIDMYESGMRPAIGHSQGVLAAALVNEKIEADELLAIARLIGVAAAQTTRRLGIGRTLDTSPMVSVRGLPAKAIEKLIAGTSIAFKVRNDSHSFVLSGRPDELAAFEQAANAAVERMAKARDAKLTGGQVPTLAVEYLDVSAPFHSELLAPAVEQVGAWAKACGLDVETATRLAKAVLIDPVDWPKAVHETVANGVKVLVDCGPGSVIAKVTASVCAGSGTAVLNLGSRTDFEKAKFPGSIDAGPDWRKWIPEVVEIDGRKVAQTAFTRLTGRSPIMLAGMTPTTAEPEIVAAAANAGYWAELAGGGQVTEPLLKTNLAKLNELLEPGRAAEFNVMFFDRYQWNLQFGSNNAVPRARANGARLDGVTISAGIPEPDEGPELVRKLHKDGFAYIAFKPGTASQISQVIDIAKAVPEIPIIIQIEDGHAGGHHSWDDLDAMLLDTYAEIRKVPHLVLTGGGGIGTPERAADYLSGEWALKYGRELMPLDGVFVGTAAMTAKEANTNPDVKQLLVETPGVDPEDAGGWVGSGASKGGMTSGLSHLLADIYEIDNDAARAERLLLEVAGDAEQVAERRDEIIEALSKTAKPYFGDLDKMTYAQVLRRYAELLYPWTDESWVDRFHDLLQRAEARLSPTQSGQIETLFPAIADAEDPEEAIAKLVSAYPEAETTLFAATDCAWFPTLCRKHPKPVGFVPVLDGDVFRWYGTDSLWQSHDRRYKASEVRVIPGPVSVAGVTTVDEPVADILARFEDACVERALNYGPARDAENRWVEPGKDSSEEDAIRTAPLISWMGLLIPNPALTLKPGEFTLSGGVGHRYDLKIHIDTAWDETPGGHAFHAVRELVIPLKVTDACATGGAPIVDEDRLPETMRELLTATAGVGSTAITGDFIPALPEPVEDGSVSGRISYDFSVPDTLGADHAAAVTAGFPSGLTPKRVVPDALLGPNWPVIYSAIGATKVQLGGRPYPIMEGLLAAVHLDHTADFKVSPAKIVRSGGLRVHTEGWTEAVHESSLGRVIEIHLRLSAANSVPGIEEGAELATFIERLAVRGRAAQDVALPPAPQIGADAKPTARRLLRKAYVTAPSDMTAFARVSGDYNPIHTSFRAAKVAGMDSPIVHGMWLSAACQHVVSALGPSGKRSTVLGWSYQMFAPVNLGDSVEISVERVGRVPGAGDLLEVTCRVEDEIVSKATCRLAAPVTAYVYPGQGVQTPGMGLDEANSSKAAREIWDRADRHTRRKLGFSILTVVRDNPTELTALGTTYRHPKGLLHLTQFTQVALATLAFAQTARLEEAGMLASGAYFAGHSLGEYTALSAYAGVFDLETVLEIVFHRGSTMHHLVPRDESGRSNYALGALRPELFGVGDADVDQYVAEVAERSGEFLEVVNRNLAGAQYSIAGTVAGLAALEKDASRRVKSGKKPFQLIPGIDVPFHSAVLRGGVGEFREHLETLLPADICPAVLVGKYIPNLTASAFSLERSFLEDIVAVAPSEPVQALLDSDELYAKALEDPTKFARMLLIELLAWQFASPVRWIETQELLLKHERVEEYIEVGLGSAPTLANLAARTLLQPQMRGCEATVLNVQRDEARVYATDTDPAEETLGAPVREEETVSAPVAETVVETAPEPRPAAEPAPVKASAPAGETPELPYTAGDAVRTLLAMTTKVRPEQMGSADTIETLTGGVSSRRNQLLMDMSAELGLASIEGASDMALGALTEKVDSLADTYQPFGAVLSGAIRERLRRVFGAAGVDQTRVGERLKSAWGLGEGWTAHVTSELMLGTREGDSARGGALAQLGTTAVANAGAADQLIDAAVEAVASAKGIAVSKAATTSSQGAMVDNAALGQLADQVLGGEGVLAEMARDILNRLGIQEKQSEQESTQAETESVLATVEAELGSNWIKYVAPAFKAEQALLIDDRWALAREDLARVYLDENEEVGSFTGLGETIAQQARWWAGKAKKEKRKAAAERLEALAEEAETPCEGQFANDVAVVTGGAPGSIAAAIIGGLLKGGATVVATASHINHRRLDWAKDLYRKNASAGAKLWLVPANLASYRDVDDTVEWIGSPYFETNGGVSEEVKPALIPSLFFPFAAPSVSGTLDDAGPEQENQARLLLWSLERSMAGLSKIGIDNDIAHRLHVVLPGSPNRGTFGGDGAYGEVKSALDAIINRWHAENDWSAHTTLVHPKIGWVRGTGLMGRNDPLVKAVEATGVRTYSTVEIADELLALCTADKRKEAETEPLIADLTGGLSKVNLTELMGQARAAMGRTEKAESVEPETIAALPTPQAAQLAAPAEWGKVSTKLEDMVVVVGIGEVGPWGSERTRHEAELGLRSDSGADLTPAGVLELAWMTGLLTWKDTPEPGWYSEAGKLVPESEIFETYRDEVVARSGVRSFVDDGPLFDLSTEQDVQVFLDKDISFKVPDAETAAMYAEFDPEHTHVAEAGGEYLVTRTAGAVARLPRKMPLTRTVGGQFPTGYDPTHWGIPGSMVEAIDKIAVWHLVATVDAFVSSGFSPAELLTEVHPADVAATLGTGFGGMSSMRKLFVDGFNGEDIPNDILQETLPNVVGGHVIQSYVGSYGPMMHPVAACATAAVSIEDAADKILVGKADFVVAGAIDDIGVESIRGFGDMNATVSAAYMREHGVDERFYSRANDRRRHGFVESQGGGTVLLTRGDIALRLGLPVLGVVAYARSSADGAHTSIPAPGLGALSAGRGGKDSKMAKALAGLGVSVDDIAVVSKHDTSTLANDPNEADLHTRLAHVLGRTPGDPLFVISQKTVTGHAKGGAAVFQAAGLCEAFATGSIPGNKALDCVDPAMEAYPELVWPRSAIELGKHSPIKAGLLTSLGFGHVSALIAMVHPAAFEEAVRSEHGAKELAKWRERAQGRLTKGARKREFAMIGRENLFEPVQSRRFAPAAVGYDPHEVEAELLLDSSKRLGEDGYYA